MTLALGIDVGGTSLRAALVDENGALVHSAKRALAERSPDAVLERRYAVGEGDRRRFQRRRGDLGK